MLGTGRARENARFGVFSEGEGDWLDDGQVDDDGGGVYRSRADLRAERASLEREAREKMVREEQVETFAEQVEGWEQEFMNSKGAARRHLSSWSLNLTDEHWNVMAPPGLSDGDLEYLEGLLRDLAPPSSSVIGKYAQAGLPQPSPSAGGSRSGGGGLQLPDSSITCSANGTSASATACSSSFSSPFTLPRRLYRELLQELRKYRHPLGRAVCMRQHLGGLDASSELNVQVLEELGEMLAQQHRAQFPPPVLNLLALLVQQHKY
jgi:hypothetical protein